MAVRSSPSKTLVKLPSNNSQTLEAELTNNEPTISRKISMPLLSPVKLTRAQTRIPIRCKQHKDAIQNSPGDFLTNTVAVDNQHGHDLKENTEVFITDMENATMIGFSQQPCGDNKSAKEKQITVPVDSGWIDAEDSSKIVSELPQFDQREEVVNATTNAMCLNCSVSKEMKVFDSTDKSGSPIGSIRCIGRNVDSTVSFLSFLIKNPKNLENHDRRTVTFNENDQLKMKNEICSEMKKQILAGMKSRDAHFYKIIREGNERLDEIDKQLKGWESFRYGLILTLIVLPLCIMGLYFTWKYFIGYMESDKPLSWGDYCLEWWDSFKTPPKKHEWLMVCFSVLFPPGMICAMDLVGKLSSHSDPLENTFMNWACEGLEDVPIDDIAKYPNVIYLDLSGNTIRKLSLDFSIKLSHIVHLDLSKNQLEKLPANIGLMVNVVHLDLYNNNIRSLPVTISDMENLNWLDMKENPVNSSLKEVVGDFWNVDDCHMAARNVVLFMAQVKLLIKTVNDFEFQNVHSFTLRSNPFSDLIIRQDGQENKDLPLNIASGQANSEFDDSIPMEHTPECVSKTKADLAYFNQASLISSGRFLLKWTLFLVTFLSGILMISAMLYTPAHMARILWLVPDCLVDRWFLHAHGWLYEYVGILHILDAAESGKATPMEEPKMPPGWGEWIYSWTVGLIF